MIVIDATGQAVDARLLVAAEWVGIVTHLDTADTQVRFVPGGLAHALDPVENRVLCDADARGLEPFALDFAANDWSFRCPECVRRADVGLAAEGDD